ncbi:MAG TPA: enoyl-CoA hydratase/isomerase family protein [Gaiellaceae bacterium]|jgi:enoyl-CoA hydratase/carnithine racemase|nr:enoyl-CoA hydratase/isomerase family protein [Gaiellaceae bacterium]
MTVGYEVRDRIAYLSFDRVEKHNALRDSDLDALIDALHRLDGDDDADVGILFGRGKSFSSGGDVQDRIEKAVDEGSSAGRVNEGPTFTQLENWKPMIAAVHGYCMGHALGTAMHCDHIVAGRDARFQVTETRIGLPMAGWIPLLGTPGFATDVVMTGRFFTAEEAWQGGLLARLVDEGTHVEGAQELARQLLEVPQGTVRATVRARRLAREQITAPYRHALGDFSWATNNEARDAVAAQSARLKGDR